MVLRLILVVVGYVLLLGYIRTKVLPLKLKYANAFFVLGLLFHTFAAFTLSITLLTISLISIIVFFLALLYMFGW
uniref:Uncharacterized protein n=1 Tax=Fervidobacterium thailandense TaxID=1008305 RepID=A0A7C4VT11_9BACT